MDCYLGRLKNGDYVLFKGLPDWDNNNEDWILSDESLWEYVTGNIIKEIGSDLKPKEIVKLGFEECEGRQ